MLPDEGVRRHLLEHGVSRSHGRVVVPPIQGLELGRVCVPVSAPDGLLGYIWLIDPQHQLTRRELDVVELASSRIVGLLRALQRDERMSEAPSLLGRLLGADPKSFQDALQEAAGLGLGGPSWKVIVIRRAPGSEGSSRWNLDRSAALEASVSREFQELGFRVPKLRVLGVERDQLADGWLAVVSSSESREATAALADSTRRIALRLRRDYGWVNGLRVGVGAHVEALDLLPDSYHTALLAIDIGAKLDPERAVSVWDELGVYRALAGLFGSRIGLADLAADIAKLHASRSGESLVHTLETYLDLAGNAAATSERLYIHRATLYQRLARIEELLQRDLADGAVRTSLHLALKAWRILQQGDSPT